MIETLIHKSQILDDEIKLKEPAMEEIDFLRRYHWGSLFAGLADHEKLSEFITRDLYKGYSQDKDIASLLLVAAKNQAQHAEWLSDYLKTNSEFTRIEKKFTFRIPKWFFKNLDLIGILYLREMYSIAFYQKLRKISESDQLPVGIKLFERMQKDLIQRAKGFASIIQISSDKPNAMKVKFSALYWFIQNKQLRHSSRYLGISTEQQWQLLQGLDLKTATAQSNDQLSLGIADEENNF